MKRPKQHQIEDNGYEQFKACLPEQWVVRSQTHDYGIDREVEIFDLDANGDGVSTGCIFKVQIKGTEDANISKKGDLVKFQLEVERISYLCNEVDIPTFFVLADVKAQKTWWYAIQIDRELKKKLSKAIQIGQSTVTLCIPSENILPNTLENLVAKLDDIKMSHACECFAELSQSNFDNLSFEPDEIEELERKFTDKMFAAKTAKFWQSKDYEGMEKASRDALSNISSSTATKVSAILCIEKSYEYKTIGSPSVYAQLGEIYFGSAVAIRKITRNENRSWKLFSALIWRAALLGKASSKDFALYMNQKIHESDNGHGEVDYFCSIMLGSARQQALREVFVLYNQCLRLLDLAEKLKEYWVIPQGILRISHALTQVFLHLWNGKLDETANLLRKSFNSLLSKAVTISFALKNWDGMGQLVCVAFTTNSRKNKQHYNEIYEWASKVLNGIPDESRRKEWVESLEQLSQTFDPDKNNFEFEEPDTPIEEEYQIYIQMAKAMGINLDDHNDQMAQIVNIGLKDLNPERVLKNCKHLFVYIGHYGLPAKMLKLYTAGSKYLRCLKKDVAIGGHSLDGIYDSMKHDYCSGCKDVDPWPDDWKWTRSWASKESEKDTHKKFSEDINSF